VPVCHHLCKTRTRPTPILAWLGRGAPGRCRCDWRNEAGSQLGGSAPLPPSLGRSGRSSRCCHEFAVVTWATVCPPPSRPRCSGAQPPPHPLWPCRGLPEAQSMGDACGPSVVMKAAVWGGGEVRVGCGMTMNPPAWAPLIGPSVLSARSSEDAAAGSWAPPRRCSRMDHHL
jgi:hypothetical protein